MSSQHKVNPDELTDGRNRRFQSPRKPFAPSSRAPVSSEIMLREARRQQLEKETAPTILQGPWATV